MSRYMHRCFFLAVLFLAQAVHAESFSVGSAVLHADKAQPDRLETWRAPAAVAGPAAELRLTRLADERIQAVKRRNATLQNKRLQVGIYRDVVSEAEFSELTALDWQPVAGGHVVQFDVVAPGAPALRIALASSRLPDSVEVRVAGEAQPDSIFAATARDAREQSDGNGWFWTAVTEGERQRIELFAPEGTDIASIASPVAAVSQFLISMQGDLEVALKGIGDSGTCNINAVCRDGALGASYVATKNAVAWMNFMSGGGTFVCTGTLLNDRDATNTPWFFTAHHCIETQSEANTLSTFWKREATTCNGTGAGQNIQVTGGADLLYSQASTDGALMRLNNSPPAGSVFAGWSSAGLSAGTNVIAIHHPSGDNKKYSRGTYLGVASGIPGLSVSSSLEVTWLEGTTEGGSSGSGLFTLGDGGYQLRGGLVGGSASCNNDGDPNNPGNRDYYSRLELIFPSIRQYLFPEGGGNGPTRNYTGQWHSNAEAGRGLSLFQTGDTLFGLWFVYDSAGRASWYQIENIWTGTDVTSGRVVRWTGSPWGPTYNPDARSFVEVGTYTLTFTSASQATFSYNVDGVNRTVTFVKITGG